MSTRTHSDEVQHKPSSACHVRRAICDVIKDAPRIGATDNEDPEFKTSVRIQVSWTGELPLRCGASHELQQRWSKEEGEDEKLVT